MPTVGLKAEQLFERLERRYTEDEFQELCFEFGLELDDVTSEKEQLTKSVGAEKAKDASDEVIFKIDIPANRYDLLCMEGIVRALRVFKGLDKTQTFTLVEPTQRQKLTVMPDTQAVRPFCVAAVLRGVTLTQDSYDSFIDLQEKLHQNICRKRTLVAIGTHDLDTIKGPFVYDAQAPKDIKFKPLRSPEIREYQADELMKVYENDLQLKQYLPIIKDKPRYPVIRDANGVVLSMPPIINGDHSKITLDTKNIFIECTATDLTKANVVLNMDLSTRTETVPVELINRRIGINCWAPRLAELLTRMQLPTEISEDGTKLDVTVTPVRPDIIHACDIWEDVAISYGYNNIARIDPQVVSQGEQQPVNKLSDQLREVVAHAGFTEALTFALCGTDDAFTFLRRENDGKTAATIANPVTQEFQIVRVNLLSGLLKTIAENRAMPQPVKVFEISDVVLLDPTTETGARNCRRLAALIYSQSPCFEEIQALCDYVMNQLGVSRCEPSDNKAIRDHGYYVIESQDPAFLGALGAADVICYGKRIGVFGVVHPEVLSNYKIKAPCGALELDLEGFV